MTVDEIKAGKSGEMTDKELLYVKTIIEESSITKAAAKLYIAQPSLSQAVQKIEASLGVHLFERTSRGLQPTRDGMKYYEVASHILRIYHELLEEIGDGRNPQEQLVLGTTTLLSNLLLGDVCPVFWKEYPGVKVHFWEESRNGILQKLNNGEIWARCCRAIRWLFWYRWDLRSGKSSPGCRMRSMA